MEAPSSRKKRLNLLYLLIDDLKTVEGYNIPAHPTPDGGKVSHQDMLLVYTDNARSIPKEELQKLCDNKDLGQQIGILADTGLRISEYGGLLFCSVESINGSQGNMYYLHVSGQLDKTRKRTEIPKTAPSYRVVPLSRELGEMLFKRKQQLEEKYGDISLKLVCGKETSDSYCTDSKAISMHMEDIVKRIPELLRQDEIVKKLKESRPYCFDPNVQDSHLLSMLTCHALRRNFCTSLYCASGLENKEIYQQMGHADKSNGNRSGANKPTQSELYQMCLKKHVSRTLYHPAHPLRYTTDGTIKKTEVPSCAVELTLPPNSQLELVIEETEPHSTTTFSGYGVTYKVEREEEWKTNSVRYALLADEDVYSIREKKKLFE